MNKHLGLENYFSKMGGLLTTPLVGRANVILYSVFKTLPKNSKALFPAVMCPSPLLMAQYAGLQPVLADVTPENGLLSPNSVADLISKYPDISVVLSVNLYGQRPSNKELLKLCRAKSILLIEDAAQWWSPSTLGENVDLAVLSFGDKKILDCGGGGLGLSKNGALLEKINVQLNQMEFTPIEKIRQLGQLYSKMYYLLQDWEEVISGAQRKFIEFSEPLRALYFRDSNDLDPQNLLNALENYQMNLKKRYDWAQKYEAFFRESSDFKTFMKLDSGLGPWRYSVLSHGLNRERFVKYLRSAGVDVSCWYPSLEKLGFNKFDSKVEGARIFGDKVINFWVEDMTDQKFEATIKTIKNFKD